MQPFAVLADPVRRRIVEVLAEGDRLAGEVGTVVMTEFGIGQPAVSNQLRTLLDAEIVDAEPQGSKRIYRLVPGALDEVAQWIDRYARLWPQRLDALETELTTGHRSSPDREQEGDIP